MQGTSLTRALEDVFGSVVFYVSFFSVVIDLFCLVFWGFQIMVGSKEYICLGICLVGPSFVILLFFFLF